MARTVNEAEYAVKRNEILDVAQQLIYTRGYEQMAIRDIVEQMQISKGAFYHYFDSKQALLAALLDRSVEQTQQLVATVIDHPDYSALQKLQQFFDTVGRWKVQRKSYMLQLLKVWHADENVLVRQKLNTTMVLYLTPILQRLVQQGIDEQVFSTKYPDHAGALLQLIMLGLGEMFTVLMRSTDPLEQRISQAERMVEAYTEAMIRVIGAPAGSICLMEPAIIREWLMA